MLGFSAATASTLATNVVNTSIVVKLVLAADEINESIFVKLKLLVFITHLLVVFPV
jgi:hypothetical protein